MATAEDAADRRCLVLSDCKPALQQIEAAYRKGSLEGLREWDRGGAGGGCVASFFVFNLFLPCVFFLLSFFELSLPLIPPGRQQHGDTYKTR